MLPFFFAEVLNYSGGPLGATLLGHEAKIPNRTTLGQDQQGTCSSSNLPDLTKCLWSEFDFSHPVYKREVKKEDDRQCTKIIAIFVWRIVSCTVLP